MMVATVGTKQEVLQAIAKNRKEIAAFGVQNLGLFGSFVRNEQRPDSDVDILVEFDSPKKTFDNFMQLATFLEELLDRHVELVTTESLSPYIGPRILDEVENVTISE